MRFIHEHFTRYENSTVEVFSAVVPEGCFLLLLRDGRSISLYSISRNGVLNARQHASPPSVGLRPTLRGALERAMKEGLHERVLQSSDLGWSVGHVVVF